MAIYSLNIIGAAPFLVKLTRYLQTCSSTVFGVMSGTRRMENFPITWENNLRKSKKKKKKKKKAFWRDLWRRCRLIVFCIMLWPILYLSRCVSMKIRTFLGITVLEPDSWNAPSMPEDNEPKVSLENPKTNCGNWEKCLHKLPKGSLCIHLLPRIARKVLFDPKQLSVNDRESVFGRKQKRSYHE